MFVVEIAWQIELAIHYKCTALLENALASGKCRYPIAVSAKKGEK
jgi:hypothetical protein